MYPHEQSYMPSDSLNIETHNSSAEHMRNYRKRKAQENKTTLASTPTNPTPTALYKIIINPTNTFRRILLVIHLFI
jgi:hypothetical protein